MLHIKSSSTAVLEYTVWTSILPVCPPPPNPPSLPAWVYWEVSTVEAWVLEALPWFTAIACASAAMQRGYHLSAQCAALSLSPSLSLSSCSSSDPLPSFNPLSRCISILSFMHAWSPLQHEHAISSLERDGNVQNRQNSDLGEQDLQTPGRVFFFNFVCFVFKWFLMDGNIDHGAAVNTKM